MDIEELHNLFKLLSFTGTLDILFRLKEHGRTSYIEFNVDISVYSMNRRLHELIQAGLIKHYLKRNKKRKEWYELTEKGEKLLRCIERIKVE